MDTHLQTVAQADKRQDGNVTKIVDQMEQSLSSFPDNNWDDMDRAAHILMHYVGGIALAAAAPVMKSDHPNSN
jgi:hypothetical protein